MRSVGPFPLRTRREVGTVSPMSDPEVDPTRVDLPPVADSGDPTSVFVPVVDDGAGGPPLGGPPPLRPIDEPDRRPWIIVAVLAAIVAVLILVLLLGGDDDGDTEASTTTSEATSTSTSSSSSSSTTTTAPSTTTTVAAVVTVPPDECAEAGEGPAKPGPAATTVFEAWVRGDESCAATLMTDDALAELFDRPGAEAQDQFQGCTEEDVPDPHADCAFTYEGGSTHYIMEFSDTEGWQVVDIEQVAD